MQPVYQHPAPPPRPGLFSLGLLGVVIIGAALALPIYSAYAFGKKYGPPGAVLGFFVPGLAIATITRVGGQPVLAGPRSYR